MGTYLSKPVTSTTSDEGKSRSLSFGVSSMQGWRMTQEDAHACLLDFDSNETEDTSLFAVFDGHGGAEVAEYAAKHLPLFIKKSDFYHHGDLENSLSEAFLTFDQSLTEPHVLQILKDMAEAPSSDEEDDKINEAIALQEEAEMPIEQLMAKYGCVVVDKNEQKTQAGGDCADASSSQVKEINPANLGPPVNGIKSPGSSEVQSLGGQFENIENGSTGMQNGSLGDGKVVENVAQEKVPAQVAETDNGAIPTLKVKIDKGKGKKVIVPSRVNAETERKPLYEKFVEDFDEEDSEESASEDDDDVSESDDDEDEDDDHEVSMGLGEIPGMDSGCTACVALVRGNNLFVANAGDSRCVVSRNGVAYEMSTDHKPEDDTEKSRIENAGGQVTSDGRVNGGLNLSRALGDHTYKENTELPLKDQMISPEPDVRKTELTDDDEFFVVACDGIWNSMTSQQVVDFVRERIKSKNLSAICEELFHACLAPDSSGDGTGCDNMTAVIVELKSQHLKRKTGKEDVSADEKPSKKPKEIQGGSSSSSSSSI